MNSNKLCKLALIDITVSPRLCFYYSKHPKQNPKREFINCISTTTAAYPIIGKNTKSILGTILDIEFDGASGDIPEDYLQQYEYEMVYIRILTPHYGVLIARCYRIYIKQLA